MPTYSSGELEGVQKVDNVQTVRQCKEQFEVLHDGWFKTEFPSAHDSVIVDELSLTPTVYPDRRPGRAEQLMEIYWIPSKPMFRLRSIVGEGTEYSMCAMPSQAYQE